MVMERDSEWTPVRVLWYKLVWGQKAGRFRGLSGPLTQGGMVGPGFMRLCQSRGLLLPEVLPFSYPGMRRV